MNGLHDASLAKTLTDAVYAAFFPSGIEDVVLAAITRLAIGFHLNVTSCDYDDAAVFFPHVTCESSSAEAVDTPPHSTTASFTATTTPKGLLLFRIRCSLESDCAETQLCSFLAAACTLRVVERLCVHQWTIPIAGQTNEHITAALRHAATADAERTRKNVLQLLSKVRTQWGCMLAKKDVSASSSNAAARMPQAALLWGPQFFESLTDAEVAFRVNCERRVMEDRPGGLKSVDLAAAAGDALWDLHHPHAWTVSMLYYNVEFFLLQDNDQWLTCGLTLSPPPPPRCGYDIDVTFQYGAEVLRHHIGRALRRGVVTLEQVKGLVPRVSADRQEIRCSKGACAMRSALASALCTYCGVAEAAERSTCPVLMLDPFCGSGTTLLEGWVQLLERDTDSGGAGVLMGSELVALDIRRTLLNTREDYLATMAALYGYAPHIAAADAASAWQRTAERVTEWRAAVERRVADVVADGSYLTCGLDGLREVLCQGVLSPVNKISISDRLSTPRDKPMMVVVPNMGCSFAAVRCDATRVPVRAGAVECIVSDMPFGRRCGSHKVNVRLYPPFLRECHRLLRSPASSTSLAPVAVPRLAEWWHRGTSSETPAMASGGRAVLLTVEYRLMLETLEQLKADSPFHLVKPPFQVDMGGLFPFVFVLDKMSSALPTESS